jgi:ribonuclease VapC
MFVDASAIVAILTGESGREELGARLDEARAPATSALVIFEAVAAIVRKEKLSVSRAERLVRDFLRAASITVIAIDDEVGNQALRAFDRYGKGRHPARLNLGDCFAYAMAKQHGVPLLYKGDDFSQTDLA